MENKIKLGIMGAEDGHYAINFLKYFYENPIDQVEISFIISTKSNTLRSVFVQICNVLSKMGFQKAITKSAIIILAYFKNKMDFRRDSSVSKIARKLNYPIFILKEKIGRPDDYNQPELLNFISCFEPDLIFISDVGIIKGDFLKTAKLGILNIHPGYLPKYRGLKGTYWQLYNMDPVGTTVHFIDDGIDTGPILKRGAIDIDSFYDLKKVIYEVQRLGVKLIYETLLDFVNDRVEEIIQTKEEGSYWNINDLTPEIKKKAISNIIRYSN